MEDGPKYIISKEGLIKLIVIALSCTTFALLVSGNNWRSSKMDWVLAAFIISFSISFLFFFFRVVGLAKQMQVCGGGCTYDGFDFLWAWFSTIWCFAASITFATNFPDNASGEWIGSIILAFVTSVFYAIEAFFLRMYAPANIGYVATKQGWVKTALVTFGAATFGLMVDSGYQWCAWGSSCEAGTTYALVAFVVAWTVTTVMWLAHMAMSEGAPKNLKKVEFVWAIISVLLFWSGASCFAAYMICSGDDFDRRQYCQKRLTGVIAGFLTGAIYVIEIVMLRP